MKRQASAQVAPTDRGGGGGEEAPDTKKAGGGPLWGGGGGGGAAQRKSRWLRSSTTARDSSAFDEEFGGRIEALDKGLKSGLSAMEERMKASEESLKVWVTQMELAIMGALNKVSSGGARGGGGHPTDEDSFTGGSTTRMNNRRRSEQVMAMTSMSESSAGGGSELASSSSSGNLDFEMARAGQHVSQMQSLLQRDTEIRSALNSIRRQVRGTARTQTRGLGESTDSEEAPYGTPRASPPAGFVDAWRRCCVIEEGSDRNGGLRKLLRMCGPVLHPDSRLRSIWNASMAVLIVYCGVAIPLEIAFENDMFYSMCATPITVPITGLLRQECVWVYFGKKICIEALKLPWIGQRVPRYGLASSLFTTVMQMRSSGSFAIPPIWPPRYSRVLARDPLFSCMLDRVVELPVEHAHLRHRRQHSAARARLGARAAGGRPRRCRRAAEELFRRDRGAPCTTAAAERGVAAERELAQQRQRC